MPVQIAFSAAKVPLPKVLAPHFRHPSDPATTLRCVYLPAEFTVTDPTAITNFVSEVGAADLISMNQQGRPDSTRLPIRWDVDAAAVTERGWGQVRAHFARANPQWRAIGGGAEVLLVVSGPQVYVSPSAYPSKLEHGRVVPTWNYAVAHLRGTATIHDDAPWLHAFVTDLTNQHESKRAEPWAVSDAPASYVEQLLTEIVGIEIAITEVTVKFKLSQNKDTADYEGVRSQLASSPHGESQLVAKLMAPDNYAKGSGV